MREKRKQMVVPAMPIHDENFLASIASHFIGCLLQQFQLQLGAVSQSSRLVFRFKDLTEVVLGKNNRILLLDAVLDGMADIDEIVAKRQVRTMLFDDPERQYACALPFLKALLKFMGSHLLPFHGECLTIGTARGTQ